jgi:GTPase
MTDLATFCGFVAFIGRPNVGKSTLLNHLLGQKVSITSKKPQTTRHRILGVKTEGLYQTIYVDTPGIHDRYDTALNKALNKTAGTALHDVEVVCFLIDALVWTSQDEKILERLKSLSCAVILLVNKVDQVTDKNQLLPFLKRVAAYHTFDAVLPISAKRGDNLEAFSALIKSKLPPSIHYFPDDQITDKNLVFQSAELIREQLMRQLGDELPYGLGIEIESFKQEKSCLHIRALIWVSKETHKQMIIGKGGAQLKIIGVQARQSIEQLVGQKIFLGLWVKVKENWTNDERHVKYLGYFE